MRTFNLKNKFSIVIFLITTCIAISFNANSAPKEFSDKNNLLKQYDNLERLPENQFVFNDDLTENITIDESNSENETKSQPLKVSENRSGWQPLNYDYFIYLTTATNTKPDTESYSTAGLFRIYNDFVITKNSQVQERVTFKGEYRSSFTSSSPVNFVINNIGSAGLIVPQFNDKGFRLTQWYWDKEWNQNRTNVSIGFLDPTNYIDTYLLGNPWEGYSNFIFSTGVGTMMIPDQSTLGISVKHIFSNNSYGIVSISDATADSTKPFDNLFEDGKLFWSLEYGLVESPEKFYSKNIHFTYWKMDGWTQYGNKASSGINFSWMYEIEKWLPFVRAGMSSGDASLLSSNITLGAGYLGFSDSLFGVAVGLGETNKAIFGQSEYQFNAEIFYKTELFNLFTLTPSIHYLDPLPLNPEHDQSWVFGLRIKGIF